MSAAAGCPLPLRPCKQPIYSLGVGYGKRATDGTGEDHTQVRGPAASRRAGEKAADESPAEQSGVRESPAQDAYLHGLAQTLEEWNSPEDERAWRDL